MDPGDVGTGAGRLADIENTGFFFRISFSSEVSCGFQTEVKGAALAVQSKKSSFLGEREREPRESLRL